MGGRGSVYVLTRSCRTERVYRVTSFANSSCTLSIGTRDIPRGAIVVYNIHFVTRAIGVLSPRGGIVLSSSRTNYPVTRRFAGSTILRLGGRRPNCTIITCIGAASRLGAIYSIYMASSSTIGVIGTVPRGSVVFVPSVGLNNCITGRYPSGGFILLRNNYPERVIISRRSILRTGTTRPGTLFLIRPRYHRRIAQRTSCVNSADKVVGCTGRDSTGRFVVNARGDVIRRLRCSYPNGSFCPISGRLIYVGVGLAALPRICGYYLNATNRRVRVDRSVHLTTGGYVSGVVTCNN